MPLIVRLPAAVACEMDVGALSVMSADMTLLPLEELRMPPPPDVISKARLPPLGAMVKLLNVGPPESPRFSVFTVIPDRLRLMVTSPVMLLLTFATAPGALGNGDMDQLPFMFQEWVPPAAWVQVWPKADGTMVAENAATNSQYQIVRGIVISLGNASSWSAVGHATNSWSGRPLKY